jgi:RNA polymerase sigma factor (sigma-70 family)
MGATDEQILEGMDMVRRLAARYRRTPLGYDDALGAGSVALVEAARRFDPGLGVPFGGYAFLRVRGAMKDACRPGGRGVRPDQEVLCEPEALCSVGDRSVLRPEAHLDVLTAVSRLRRRLRTVLLRHACGVPSCEIAADLGVSESRVSQLLAMARRRVRVEAGLLSD